jgi:hypothetical protein
MLFSGKHAMTIMIMPIESAFILVADVMAFCNSSRYLQSVANINHYQHTG